MLPRILVLEDDFLFARAIVNDLNSIGFSAVKVVASPSSLKDALVQGSYDLLFLDILLGGDKTGLDLAQELDLKSQLPFIVLSNQYDSKYVLASKDVGASAYLLKGASSHQLGVTIQTTLLEAKKEYVVLESKRRFRKKDILCVSSYGHNKIVYFIGDKGKMLISNISFNELIEKINYKPLLQVSIACYVNLDLIDDYSKGYLRFPKGIKKYGQSEPIEGVSIGRVYKEQVMEYFRKRDGC